MAEFKTIAILSNLGEFLNFHDKNGNIVVKLTVCETENLTTYTKVEVIENNIEYDTSSST